MTKKYLFIFLSVFYFLLSTSKKTFGFTNQVTIEQAGGQSDPTTSGPIEFTVVFDEPVTGFTNGDITLSASTAGGTLSASVTEIAPMDGTTYTVSVSGMTTGGDVIATIPAGAATLISDGVTTTAASTSGDNTVTFDAVPFYTNLNPPDDATGISVSLNSVVITFSEDVVNVGDNSNDDNRIRLRTPGVDVEVIDPIAPGKVTIAGNVVTINLTASLSPNTTYGIRIGNSVFEDLTGNPFSGTNTAGDWNFTTENGPNISSYTTSPTCVGETLVINGSGFGAAVPSVTVNGVAATVGAHNSTTITITVPNTTTGTVSVTNNSNGLSDTGPSLTVNPAILTNKSVVEVNSSVTTGATADIQLLNSQNGVNYTLRQISPFIGTVDGPDAGNGGTLTFTTPSLTPAGTYQFRVRGTQGSCTADMTDIAVINVINFAANAGNDTTICNGDAVTLGGKPTIVGGSGFNNIVWSSNPAGFTSNSTNPKVVPTVTTTYTITVTDSNNDIRTDDVIITVNSRTDANDMDIIFSPNQVAFSSTDDPVNLSYTIVGSPPGTGVFTGPGVNSSNSKFYPNAAPLGNSNITLTFTNASGCPTPIQENVNVYDPNSVLNFLQPTYCPVGVENLTIQVPLDHTYTGGVTLYRYSFFPLFATTQVPTGSAWTTSGTSVTLNLDHLTPAGYYFSVPYNYTYITYTYITILGIQIAIPQVNVVVVYRYAFFTISTPPTARIFAKIPGNEICRNETPIDLTGSPIGGIWQGAGVTASVGNDNSAQFAPGDNGTATFNPATGLIGFNNIRYIYEDNSGCRDTAYQAVTVRDVPVIDFLESNGCIGIPVTFDPNVTIPPTVSINTYLWDFDDDRGQKDPVLIDPIEHTYISSNDYDVTFSAITSDGCVSEVTKQISIGDIPDLAFKWANVCDGDPTRFSIKSDFLNTTPADVMDITWDFGDGTPPFVKSNPLKGDTVRMHPYASTGYFTATAIIESDLGCTTTKTQSVYKVPKTGIVDGLNPYFENFDAVTFEAHGWVTGGQNSSWEWGAPANTLIDSDAGTGGNAWVTNLTGSYNVNEKSWVHSPCINLAALDRPVLSLDIRSLTRKQVEGAVLQISKTNSTNNDADWKTVGQVGAGVNWFNDEGIFSNPGNQLLKQTGWTGFNDSTEWRHSIISLDDALSTFSQVEKQKVRFRIAFSSPSDASSVSISEGFAFDNFLISQRDRVILLEAFVNSGGSTNDNNFTLSNQVNTFIGTKSGEIIKLEYHLGISGPNDDPIYLDNTSDANARGAFYGVTSTPFVFLDGNAGNNYPTLYEGRTLKSAGASIDTIFTTNLPAETMNIEVRFTAKEDLPASVKLHIAAVEKLITDPAARGTNGLTEFRHVMKKMLPSVLGTSFPLGVAKDATNTVNVSWTPQAYDLANLAIVAFLQDEITGEILQARLLNTPQYIPPASIITGLEPEFLNRVLLYPNPAKEELNVRLPAQAIEEIEVELLDSYGRCAHKTSFRRGEDRKSIDTLPLASGMYVLQLGVKNGSATRKKVLIVH